MSARLACPLCRDERARYGFTVDTRSLYYCGTCGVLFRAEVHQPGGGPLACTELGFLRDVHVPRALEPAQKLDALRQLGVVAPGVRVLALRDDDRSS